MEITPTGGYQFEYRGIMERVLGRKLTRDEVVHHKDGDKTNNDIANLEVMLRGTHVRLHNYLSPRKNHLRDDRGRFTFKHKREQV